MADATGDDGISLQVLNRLFRAAAKVVEEPGDGGMRLEEGGDEAHRADLQLLDRAPQEVKRSLKAIHDLLEILNVALDGLREISNRLLHE